MKICACAAWAPGLTDLVAWQGFTAQGLPADDGSVPDVSFIDPLLRRRLGRLSRMALHVAHGAASDLPAVATIFASRHGELSRTVSILHALAASEAPSPAAFSLSVHNAAAGIFAITRADRSPSIALAAGDETLLWALLEATIRLAAVPAEPVLLVYADEPLPSEYGGFASAWEPAHALALLLRMGEGLHLHWTENCASPASAEPLSLAILMHLLGHRERIEWHGTRLSVYGHA